jgi:hypothetical protein
VQRHDYGGSSISEEEAETLSVPQYGGKEELDRTNLVRAITIDEIGGLKEVSYTKADLSRELRVQKVPRITSHHACVCHFWRTGPEAGWLDQSIIITPFLLTNRLVTTSETCERSMCPFQIS